ncbi:MAG: hypothetical protein ACRECC_01890, partial [Pseudolabrys sp.]
VPAFAGTTAKFSVRPDEANRKNKNTGENFLSGAPDSFPQVSPGFVVGVVVGLVNSERTQQNGADENKHSAHSQHIQLQGKVHGMCLPRRDV